MEIATIGDRVTVAGSGPVLDGIVFDTPSRTKAVVAVVDPNRGPLLRTVNPKILTPRPEAGPDDHALELLLRRTPPPIHGSARGAGGSGVGRSGFKRGAAHRPTGK